MLLSFIPGDAALRRRLAREWRLQTEWLTVRSQGTLQPVQTEIQPVDEGPTSRAPNEGACWAGLRTRKWSSSDSSSSPAGVDVDGGGLCVNFYYMGSQGCVCVS